MYREENYSTNFQRRVDNVITAAECNNLQCGPLTCSAGLPYPPLEVTRKDPQQGIILLDLYAGMISEFTAFNSFQYQYLVEKKQHPVISRIIRCVTANEEFHVENLNRLIKMFGANPKYYDSAKKFWNGSEAIYGTNVEDRLEGDIAAEIAIIKLYKQTENKLSDPAAIRFIKRQALDDVFHLELFQETLRRFNCNEL